jgi:glutathione S-transferase
LELTKIMALIVYGTPISVYVRVVRLLLEAVGADYTLQDIGIFNGDNTSAEYLAKNPFGKVPTLEVDGTVIYETVAIADYLDAVVADHKFTPSDPLTRARMRQIMAIVDSYFYKPSIGTIVIQRVIVPSQGGQTDEEAVKGAIAPAKTAAEAIEALIVGTPYLLGSEMTIADFFVIPVLVYLSKTPEFAAITAQTPKLKTWWDQAKELPLVKKVCG